MALANKYKTTYCDVYGRTCEAFILQEGYVGSVTELEAQTTPFLIAYDSGSDFKFEPIRASKATLGLVLGNGIDLDEFWTQNEREYQIAHYISGVLDWIGWVIPNGFTYQLTGGIYYAELEATDGLETLDAYKFWNEATESNYGIDNLGVYHTGQQFDMIFILTECLKKIGLGLDVWVAVDVYEQNMLRDVDTRDGCPLAQASVNVRTYIGDTDRDDIPYWRDTDEAFNSLEVLENLAYMFGAKVYQSQGVWRFKRVNADIDFGTGATTRYWYKFDQDADYILTSREALSDTKTIPCMDVTNQASMVEDDHTLTMDEIYKRFRVNYKYTYARLGDSDVNLIKNGGFTESWANSTPESAPPYWERWRERNKWRPKIEQVSIPAGEQPLVAGNTDAIQFGSEPTTFSNTDPYASVWAGLRARQIGDLKQGDELYLSFFVKMKPRIGYEGHQFMISLTFVTPDGIFYKGSTATNLEAGERAIVQWYERDPDDYLFYACDAYRCEESAYKEFISGARSYTTYQWIPFVLKIRPLPANGILDIKFHGLATIGGSDTANFPAFKIYGTTDGVPDDIPAYRVARPWDANRIRPQLTGVALAIIPDESKREKLAKYVYDNADQSYSLQKKPIEVLHGDTPQKYTISGITVPLNTDSQNTPNVWDVIDDSFGLASLGLTQAKSIMQLYSKPNKILEGTIQHQDCEFDSVYTFDALGTERMVLQRGVFNRKWGYVENATLIEISDEVIDTDLGEENGFNTDAIWEPFVGVNSQRCEKSAGLNTGDVEQLEIDVNPASPTRNTTRWVNTGVQNLTFCPIGTKSAFIMFMATTTTVNETYVTTYGVEKSIFLQEIEAPDRYWFVHKNLGYDYTLLPGTQTEVLNYFYFLHLPSYGTISLVTSAAQPDTTTDWGYLSDLSVGGTTYKVFRTDYPLARFKVAIGFEF